MRAYIEAQGHLLLMKALDTTKLSNRRVSTRKKITGFSAASRRRLLRFMARLLVSSVRATFITLTFSEKVSNEEAKNVLKRFVMRLRRAYPEASGVWRMEYQERGAIHFHLLMFRLPFIKQSDLQRTWEACTREVRSIVDIRLVRGTRQVMGYVSKYIAKKSQVTSGTSLDDVSYQHARDDLSSGRFWGWINKEALPLGEKIVGLLFKRDAILQVSRRSWYLIGSDNEYNSVSFHLFTDWALNKARDAIEQGGLTADEWLWSRQIPQSTQEIYDYVTQHFPEAVHEYFST